jgi:enoyl-CoA hydratase
VTDGSDEVLTEVDGSVGLITLNRPKAINSLNQQMVDALTAVLTGWADDDAVRAVVLSGAGERGLCAGGDVVSIYHSARRDGVEARRFWRDEYLLNAQIAGFPKPYVAVMDGIVMGGGVGVSAHANTRVVTDTSKIAMPEVGIGFIPDVGGTYLLSRAPGQLGLHAALSGAPFSGADAIALGFADHYVPQVQLEGLVAAVVEDGVDAAVKAFAIEPPPITMPSMIATYGFG